MFWIYLHMNDVKIKIPGGTIIEYNIYIIDHLSFWILKFIIKSCLISFNWCNR